jgi:hypothetical protein
MPSFSSWPFSLWRSAPAPSASRAPTAPASKGSWRSETLPSATSAAKPSGRPSFYLLATSFLLLVAGVMSLQGGDNTKGSRNADLSSKGWIPWDGSLPCPHAEESFFELESEADSLEAYRAGPSLLVSRPPTPGFTYTCRPVAEPHFIQEIL